MTTYFVSRHPGAAAWAQKHGHEDARTVVHFETENVAAGDVVLGTLPVDLAAEVCLRGGRYFHLILRIPSETRGRELTVAEMEAYGARLQEFVVTPA
jgi:CRISPR-associated protein Csx16